MHERETPRHDAPVNELGTLDELRAGYGGRVVGDGACGSIDRGDRRR